MATSPNQTLFSWRVPSLWCDLSWINPSHHSAPDGPCSHPPFVVKDLAHQLHVCLHGQGSAPIACSIERSNACMYWSKALQFRMWYVLFTVAIATRTCRPYIPHRSYIILTLPIKWQVHTAFDGIAWTTFPSLHSRHPVYAPIRLSIIKFHIVCTCTNMYIQYSEHKCVLVHADRPLHVFSW